MRQDADMRFVQNFTPPKSHLWQDAALNVSLSTSHPPDHSGNGGIRGILLDGDTLVATGYTDGFEGGCLFINDEGTAMLWTFDVRARVSPRNICNRYSNPGCKDPSVIDLQFFCL